MNEIRKIIDNHIGWVMDEYGEELGDDLEKEIQLLFQREKDAHDYILAETIESYEEKSNNKVN